ncbi:MAG: hypothetical protein P4L76_13910 [Beijerinckiaceae bacterium]|nr:hypothetical protein [Beijerinckiaceae bacterium]
MSETARRVAERPRAWAAVSTSRALALAIAAQALSLSSRAAKPSKNAEIAASERRDGAIDRRRRERLVRRRNMRQIAAVLQHEEMVARREARGELRAHEGGAVAAKRDQASGDEMVEGDCCHGAAFIGRAPARSQSKGA